MVRLFYIVVCDAHPDGAIYSKADYEKLLTRMTRGDRQSHQTIEITEHTARMLTQGVDEVENLNESQGA